MHEWGRWGPSDEAGAVTCSVPSRFGAAWPASVPASFSAWRRRSWRAGASASSEAGTGALHAARRRRLVAGLPERAGFGFADDVITLATHGVTHVDALAHVWQDGQLYNGTPASAVTSRGAGRLGIDKMRPIVTRGVFVDAAPDGYRDPADRVTAAELQRLVAGHGVELTAGDALLVRTGWLPAVADGRADGSAWPGLDGECAGWLAERDVVLVGADNPGVEAYPSGDPDCQVPLHISLIRDHGSISPSCCNSTNWPPPDRPHSCSC